MHPVLEPVKNIDTGVVFEPKPTYAPIVRALREIIADHEKAQFTQT